MKHLLFLSAALLLMTVTLPTRAATLESVVGGSTQNERHASDDTAAHSSEPKAADADADHHDSIGLKRVEPKQVCMVNNKFMGAEQISIIVNGKTYYGCCPMCKERLKNK